MPLEGLVYAALSYSTIARGRIATLDTAEAEAAPGVALVMTHRNAPRMKPPPVFDVERRRRRPAATCPSCRMPAIHWNGQPVARGARRDAGTGRPCHIADRALPTTRQPAVTVSLRRGQGAAHRTRHALGEPPSLEIGDAEAALAAGRVQGRPDLSARRAYNHNAIELHAATVAWEGGRARPSTTPRRWSARTAWTLAQVFGLKEDQVRVLSPFVGGGFGGKGPVEPSDPRRRGVQAGRPAGAASCCRARACSGSSAGAPRPSSASRSAPSRDGTLAALIHTGVAAMTTHNDCPEQFTFPARHLYAAETFKLEQEVADMDMLANTFMRAPGESVGTFALECAIDELAADDEASTRSSCGGASSPRRIRPRARRSRRATSSRPIAAAPSGSAGTSAIAAPRPPARGRMADRHGLRDRAPIPTTACRAARRASRSTADGRARCQTAQPRDGHGHRHGAGAARRRAARPAARGRDVRLRRHDLPSGTMAGGSSQTASIGAAVIAAQPSAGRQELLKLAGNDSPLAGLKAGRGRGARRRALRKRDDPVAARELRLDPGARQARRARSCEAGAPLPLEMHEVLDALLRRAVLRGAASTRSPARRGCRASSARSTAAASSMPRPRPASSAAASSWGWAWR